MVEAFLLKKFLLYILLKHSDFKNNYIYTCKEKKILLT